MHFQKLYYHNAVCITRRWREIVVVVAPIENFTTSKPLNISPKKSQILICDTVVANERFVIVITTNKTHTVYYR